MNGHHLKLLKELSKDNKLSQRELSKKLGVSLGSVNYVLSNLIDAGLISRHFLKRKLDEYEMLKMEIEELQRDIEVE